MKIRALFLDMDGTLLQENNTISPSAKRAVRQLVDSGVYVFLATGRHLDITLPYHSELGLKTPLICLNGAAVYDPMTLDPLIMRTIQPDKMLHEKLLQSNPRNLVIHAEEGLRCLHEDDMIREWTREGGRPPVYAGPDVLNGPSRILKYSLRSDAFIHLPQRMYKYRCDFIRWTDGFELVPKQVSKWTAVQYMMQCYGFRRSQTAAFGDGPNDVEMLRGVGIGTAMENASVDVKQAADGTAPRFDEDGLARYMETMWLNTTMSAEKA
ncbi:HAD family hydrolase [Alkalicoccus chagannorensis]|uniref:HAD family hydrolase n=1 Tax=Alkalicoccus chagannorensis TaxID=427072 RepID=UPI00040D3BFE|nr:HAD family hydrolase [Alkalicoccus chagannorensis]